jgi:rhodanese-related sulfurtransferase
MRKQPVLLVLITTMLTAVGWPAPQSLREISPSAAFERLRQPSTYLIDVRTVAEYVYVGHPEAAHNIPLLFWDEPNMQQVANVNFVEDIKRRFKPGDTLLLICRSGGRSAQAFRMLRRAGFQNLLNVINGFEGQKDADGLRTRNGWKNDGLPYTYTVNPDLIYRSSGLR